MGIVERDLWVWCQRLEKIYNAKLTARTAARVRRSITLSGVV